MAALNLLLLIMTPELAHVSIGHSGMNTATGAFVQARVRACPWSYDQWRPLAPLALCRGASYRRLVADALLLSCSSHISASSPSTMSWLCRRRARATAALW